MPHYKDGTPAKVGDRVKGHGYNVKGDIEGYVLDVTPGATSCNVKVATVSVTDDETLAKELQIVGGAGTYPTFLVEYGQADAFELAPRA